MTLEQLITNQQLKIHQLEADNKSLIDCVQRLYMDMICIGGPLNDNVLEYSPKQLMVFQRMDRHIQEVKDLLYKEQE
jgi:hypothetical protein